MDDLLYDDEIDISSGDTEFTMTQPLYSTFPDAENGASNDSGSTLAIALGVVIPLLLCAAAVVGVLMLLRLRKRRNAMPGSEDPEDNNWKPNNKSIKTRQHYQNVGFRPGFEAGEGDDMTENEYMNDTDVERGAVGGECYSSLQPHEKEAQRQSGLYEKLRNPVNVLRDLTMRDSGVGSVNMSAADSTKQPLYQNTDTFSPQEKHVSGGIDPHHVDTEDVYHEINTGTDTQRSTSVENPTTYANVVTIGTTTDVTAPTGSHATSTEDVYEKC